MLLLFNRARPRRFVHPPSPSIPLDWLFIHVPVKMFTRRHAPVRSLAQLFMALGWDFGAGGLDALVKGLWPAFGIVTGLGAFSAL